MCKSAHADDIRGAQPNYEIGHEKVYRHDKFMIVNENVLEPTILQFSFVHAQSVSDLQLTATVHTFFPLIRTVCDGIFVLSLAACSSFSYTLMHGCFRVSLFLRSIQPITLICFTCPTYLYYQLCKSTLSFHSHFTRIRSHQMLVPKIS